MDETRASIKLPAPSRHARLRRRWPWLFVLAPLILLNVHCAATGYLHAHLDLLLGRPSWKVYGLGGADQRDLAWIMRRRYNVRLNTVAGCVVNDLIVDYARTYNGIIRADLRTQYGRDAINECEDEALSRRHDRWAQKLGYVKR